MDLIQELFTHFLGVGLIVLGGFLLYRFGFSLGGLLGLGVAVVGLLVIFGLV
jgi:hypothetical protein